MEDHNTQGSACVDFLHVAARRVVKWKGNGQPWADVDGHKPMHLDIFLDVTLLPKCMMWVSFDSFYRKSTSSRGKL